VSRCLETRSVSLGLSHWRHTLRSFSLHRSCAASSIPSGRTPVASTPSVNRVRRSSRSVCRPSGPGHRSLFPLAVACRSVRLPRAPRMRWVLGSTSVPGRSTSGPWSAVKSVASFRHFCRKGARCSLGLCQLRVCSFHLPVDARLHGTTPRRLAAERRSAPCERTVSCSQLRTEARLAGKPARTVGGVHPDQPPSRDPDTASRDETADPTCASSRRSADPEGAT